MTLGERLNPFHVRRVFEPALTPSRCADGPLNQFPAHVETTGVTAIS